jgi:hypothetical protein
MDDGLNAQRPLDKAVPRLKKFVRSEPQTDLAPAPPLASPAAPPLASPLPCGSTILLQHRCVPLPANCVRAQRWPTPTGPPPAARCRRRRRPQPPPAAARRAPPAACRACCPSVLLAPPPPGVIRGGVIRVRLMPPDAGDSVGTGPRHVGTKTLSQEICRAFCFAFSCTGVVLDPHPAAALLRIAATGLPACSWDANESYRRYN